MTTGWSGSSKRDSLRVAGGLTLLALCAVDAGMQILALVAPHPFRGIGLLAIPFLPVILAYHASLLLAIFAGVPLAIACFWLRGSARVAIGVALIALTAANIVPIIREQEESRIATRVAEGRNAAFVAEVEKCTAVMAQRAREATTYFSEPRKVVAIGGPYAVEFENGMRIHLPAIHPPQPFHHFFYDYLTGSQVRVALRPPSAELLTAWCRLAGAAVPTGYSQAYEGDVYLTERKVDAGAYLDREFPRPARPDSRASAPAKSISRWFDPYSGDRTYSTTGTKPVAGYILEGQPFAVRASPGADSLDLYLCNFPLQRPSSPEHFLSTDGGCEGQEKISLLGHISPTRDGQTPRALLRCLGTVRAALRTGPRHLATTDVLECGGHSIEAVLGYVEG